MSHPDADKSDAEVLAWSIDHVTRCLDLAIRLKGEGKSEEDVLRAVIGGCRQIVARVLADDVRELGIVPYPLRAYRHWVYRDRKRPERVYLLSWQRRMQLQTVGFVDMAAFTNEGLD